MATHKQDTLSQEHPSKHPFIGISLKDKPSLVVLRNCCLVYQLPLCYTAVVCNLQSCSPKAHRLLHLISKKPSSPIYPLVKQLVCTSDLLIETLYRRVFHHIPIEDLNLLNTTLMSVDLRTSLNCLRHPSRFTPLSRTQLSRVHTGDSIQNIRSKFSENHHKERGIHSVVKRNHFAKRDFSFF